MNYFCFRVQLVFLPNYFCRKQNPFHKNDPVSIRKKRLSCPLAWNSLQLLFIYNSNLLHKIELMFKMQTEVKDTYCIDSQEEDRNRTDSDSSHGCLEVPNTYENTDCAMFSTNDRGFDSLFQYPSPVQKKGFFTSH